MSIILTHTFKTKYDYDKLSYLIIAVWVILALVDTYQLIGVIQDGHTVLISYKADDIIIHSVLAWIGYLLLKTYRTLKVMTTTLTAMIKAKPDENGEIHINIDETEPLKDVVDE